MVQSHELPERMVEINGIRKYRINVQEAVREENVVYTYDEVEFNVDIPIDISDAKVEKLEAKLLAEKLKADKDTELGSIVVEVNGKVFDGNETARNNMLARIQASQLLNIESTYWKLADNNVVEVTVDEIKEALALAIQRVGEIVTNG